MTGITVETLSADVRRIDSAVRHVMHALTPALEQSARKDRVELALREAVSNAVRQGSELDPAKTVRIEVVCDHLGLVLVVRDRPGGAFGSVCEPTGVGLKRFAER